MSERRRAREAAEQEQHDELDERTIAVERHPFVAEASLETVHRADALGLRREPAPLTGETEAVVREPAPETAVVERASEVEDRTVVVDRPSEPEDRTVVVERGLPESGATIRPEPDEVDEATEVVSRPGAHPLIEEDTVVADRGGWLPEGTVRVGGAPAQAFSGPLGGSLGQAPSAPANRFAPPVGGRRAVLGAGAGATSRYTTRRVVAPAPPSAPIAQAVDATRDPNAALPSVRRRARRGALVSLVSAAAALIVTVGGLALVIPLLLAG